MDASSVHKTPVDNTLHVKFTPVMSQRDRVAARLRQLPGVLDKQDFELAEICGVTRQAWSNYKSTAVTNEIPPEVALELWHTFRVPMMWIYGGDASATPDNELRIKLHQAERTAEIELAKPSRRGPSASIAIAVLAGSFLFAACSQAGHHGKLAHERPIGIGRISP